MKSVTGLAVDLQSLSSFLGQEFCADEVPELGNLLCSMLSVAVRSLRADSLWELGQYQGVFMYLHALLDLPNTYLLRLEARKMLFQKVAFQQ